MITTPTIDEYFREAETWDADRAMQFRRSARTAWWVAGAGWICAVTSASALCLLMPLKRVDPFVVRVDNSTGIVDVHELLLALHAEIEEGGGQVVLDTTMVRAEVAGGGFHVTVADPSPGADQVLLQDVH